MKKLTALTAALLVLCSATSGAFNKDKFSVHFRKAFNLDAQLPLVVGEPMASKFDGLLSFPVTVGGQQQVVYITKDERFYFWGTVLDLNTDPDKDRASRISLENVHVKGPKDAPVTIVEFSDIQCPNCQKAHSAVDEQLFKDFPNQVKLVYKHFPLSMHEWAEPAAVATECAGREGNDAFWKMTDALFKAGPEITAANLREKAVKFAGDLKLNTSKFKACLDNPKMVEKIRKDRQEGAAVGVNATPSFFVNGRMIRGNRYEDLKSVVKEKLIEASSQK